MIDVAFIYFRTTTLQHLDQAWYSLSKQDFFGVRSVHFIDNNTPDAPVDIEAVVKRYPLSVPVFLHYEKHGDSTKTHSWSINEACRQVSAPWMFFTRSDYLLDFDCLRRFKREVDHRGGNWRGFVTSHCYQMGCDAQLSNTDVFVDLDAKYPTWRTEGPQQFVGKEPAALFHSTDSDAGVWMTSPAWIKQVGGANEQMTSWGYQQSIMQRALRTRAGVEMLAIPEYLFFHLHHAAPRDFAQAQHEYDRFGGNVY
jgi:hypothetical protein